MRPSKITPEIRARCHEVAMLKMQTPTLKELESETGIKPMYLAKVIRQIIASAKSIAEN